MAGNLHLQLLPTNPETTGKPGERLIQVGWLGHFTKLNYKFSSCRPDIQKEKYVYNIKEKMQEFRKIKKPLNNPLRKPAIMKSRLLAGRREGNCLRRTKSLNYYDLRYPKPVYSPRFRSKFSKSRERLGQSGEERLGSFVNKNNLDCQLKPPLWTNGNASNNGVENHVAVEEIFSKLFKHSKILKF